MSTHLVILGAGITGLAAAWEAVSGNRRDDRHITVTILEASGRAGGLVKTSDFLGAQIDEAADAFLARVPEAIELCKELGLQDRFTHPKATRAKVWDGRQLRWFPKTSVMGIPLDMDDLKATGLLSDQGRADVAAEQNRQFEIPATDTSIGAFLQERFGHELVAKVVGPLVGGISAGEVDQMSLMAVLPQVADASKAAGAGSLSDELRRRAASADSGAPIFNALIGGTQTLTDALVERLESRGVDIRLNSAVQSISRDSQGVQLNGPWGALHADRVLICTSAAVASELLEPISETAAAEVGSIGTASATMVAMAFPRDVEIDPEMSGFLIPRGAGLTLTAVSVGSSKWSHWGDGEHLLLRTSVGHRTDRGAALMEEPQLLDAIQNDLSRTLGIERPAVASRISRWIDGFHQYDVGHLDRCDRIDSALASQSDGSIAVAGAAYRGMGIPACIRQGRLGARALLT